MGAVKMRTLLGLFLQLAFLRNEGVIGLIQFAQRPENQTIRLGDDFVVPCSVKGAAEGQVVDMQWSVNGELYGSPGQRNMEAYDRSTVFGSVLRNEYNLRVVNAKLSDNGVYECQVPATEGVPGDGIKSRSYISVMVPPNNLTLEGARDGMELEVRQDQVVGVSCIATGARPAPIVKWFRNGELITDGVEYSDEVTGENLINGVAKLSLPAQKEYHSSVFTCQVTHDALPPSSFMRTNFTLKVLYPPGVPTINGYVDTGKALIAGQRLSLECVAENGIPFPTLYWFKNSVRIDDTYSTDHQNKVSVNKYEFQVSPEDNGAEYRCEAKNFLTPVPLSKTIKLKVKYPPEKVEIHGPTFTKLGEPVDLQCISSPASPEAKIEWVLGGDSHRTISSVTQPDRDGGLITVSNITITPEERTNIEVACSAYVEGINKRASTSRGLKVYYPPESLEIAGYDGEPLKEGMEYQLTCVARGGMPAPTLIWYKGKQRMNGTTSFLADGNGSILKFRVSESDNDAKYRCEATGPAIAVPLKKTVKLKVQYAPKFVNVRTKPKMLKAGVIAHLECESGPSNPAAEVSWWRDGKKLQSYDSHKRTSREHGGWIVVTKYHQPLKDSDDGAEFVCKAENAEVGKIVNRAIVLDVLYAPVFDASSPQEYEVLENQSVALNFTAHGKPEPLNFSWWKGSQSVREIPGISVELGWFNVTNVKREHAGNYTLEARNSLGTSNITVQLSVLYPARIVHFPSERRILSEGNSTALRCRAEGNPWPKDMVKWEGEGITKNMKQLTESDGTAVLYIEDIRRNQSGSFFCVANNGRGEADRREVAVLVEMPPTLDRSSPYSRAAGVEGGSALLQCRAEGVPPPRISWRKLDKDGKPSETWIESRQGRYRLEYRTEKMDTVVTGILEIQDVTKADYGDYECVAQNMKGRDEMKVNLATQGPPDSPYDLKFVNSTKDSITLAWKAGFNGGLPTQIRIRYRHLDGKKFTDITVEEQGASRYTIKGLGMNQQYEFSFAASNSRGFSSWNNAPIILAQTSGGVTSQEVMPKGLPFLAIIMIGVFVVLFIVLIICIACVSARRRKSKKMKEKANARLVDAGNRPVEMYGGGGEGGQAAGLRPDSHYAAPSSGHRGGHSEFSDRNSVRTIIEVDSNGQPVYYTERISPGSHQTYLMDDNTALVPQDLEDPSGMMYAETLRANSMQRRILNGNYPSSSIVHPMDNYEGHTMSTGSPEPPPPAPDHGMDQSVDNLPPPMGPLRNLSEELSNYAPYPSVQYQQPNTNSNPRNGYFRSSRYSPSLNESGSSTGIPTMVTATNGTTPYAEVRPVQSLSSPHHRGPSSATSPPGSSNLPSPHYHHHSSLQRGPGGGSGPMNGSESPLLSTFSPNPPRGKLDYMNLEHMSGDLV